MKLKIQSKSESREFNHPVWIYIPNRNEDWIRIHCSDSKISSLLVDREFFQSTAEGTVIDSFSKAIPDSSELKKRLEGSSFIPVLKRRVKDLSPVDQMKVLANTVLFRNPTIVHFKMPSNFLSSFNPGLVELLLRYLVTLEGSVLWEDTKNGFESYFSHFLSLMNQDNKLPSRLEELSLFEPLPFHPFRTQIKATGSNLSFEVGDIALNIDGDEFPSLLGLVNQDLILCLNEESFDTSKKERKDHLKVDLLTQNKKGLFYYQTFYFESIPMRVKSNRRSATPFIFVKLNLHRIYLFHPHTGERLFPAT